MEKFQDLVLKLAAEANPNTSLTPAVNSLVQARVSQFFAQYRTPDHPPYSAMIERAIKELNEKEGSTMESISQYLMKEYSDLPWAHSTLLKHHLGILCQSGDINLNHDRYMISSSYSISLDAPEVTICKQKLTKMKRRKWRSDWEMQQSRKRRMLANRNKNQLILVQEKQLTESRLHSEKEEEETVKELQLTDPSAITEPDILRTPERSPGFETITLENSSHFEARKEVSDSPSVINTFESRKFCALMLRGEIQNYTRKRTRSIRDIINAENVPMNSQGVVLALPVEKECHKKSVGKCKLLIKKSWDSTIRRNKPNRVRRRSTRLAESNSVTTMTTCTELIVSCEPEICNSIDSNISCKRKTHERDKMITSDSTPVIEQQPESQMMPETFRSDVIVPKMNGIKTYCRRIKGQVSTSIFGVPSIHKFSVLK